MRKIFFFIVLIFIVFSSIAQTKKDINGHIAIRYDQDVESYAIAGARILDFVWDRLHELGFAPPEKIAFNLVKSDKNVLFVDKDKPIITLEYTTLNPSEFNADFVYGLCHEMGHLCMFHITPNKNNWMTKDYREGWADVFGKNMVGLVYEEFGLDAWPDPYNYLKRTVNNITIRKQTIEKGKGAYYDFYISADFWEKLVDEKGMDKIPFFFKQIKSMKVRNPNADKKLRNILVEFDVSNDLLYYFDRNKKYLIRSE